MAINVTFGGATIFKPSSVSRETIELGGGFQIGPAGLVAVIGEADAGRPGASETNIRDNRFSGDQIVQIRDKYRSGPIVDSANFLFAPAADGAIPSGTNTLWIYKTNASTRASVTLANSYGSLESVEYGVGGNRLTYTCTLVSESAPSAEGAVFDETALAGALLTIRLNGDSATDNTFTAPAVASNAALVTAVADGANWSAGVPSGFSVTVGGADTASTLTIAMDADANAHQSGHGRCMELAGAPASYGLTAGIVSAALEPSVTIKLDQKRDNIQEEEELGGAVVLEIGNSSAGSSAAVSITDKNIELKEDGSTAHTLIKSSFATIRQVAEEINLKSGWSASVSDSVYNQLSPAKLDEVTDVGAWSPAGEKPARLKRDASDVAEFFELSLLASITNQSDTGLPDAESETSFAGGSKGASSTADVVDALDKFTKFHVNFIVPLFSRDATSDISDGLTDDASTYTIDGIHQAVKTHISLMKSTKKKSERQGFLSLKDTYVNCKSKAGDLGDERLQLMIQDVRQIDAAGNIKWFQPWAFSAILAGARSGAPIGEPMTYKFMNVSGLRQTAQSMSTPEENIVVDFDPDLQADDAIQAGITFMEEAQNGGFRVVVDNTTYGVDDNFLRNRANVRYAADIVLFNYRQGLERFIGRKNTVSVADIAAAASSILAGFLNQGITVSTEDAPQGFKQLTVQLDGNIIRTSVTIKIVEGIDFVLSDINIQRASAQA